MKSPSLIIFFVPCLNTAFAQENLSYEAPCFVSGKGDPLPCRTLIPEGYKAAGQPLLLLLFLHGADERGHDNKTPLTQGAQHKVVPAEKSRSRYQALQAAGGSAKHTKFPDARHNSRDNAFAEPGLFHWLFSQHKTD